MAINATIGGSVSNSYVTLDEADTYFESRNHSSDWDECDDETKEKHLITATNQIDWFFDFNGSKTDSTQALSFPRYECYDNKLDEYVESDIIPNKVKYAVFELVLASLNEDRFADDDMIGLQEVQIGTLRVKANSSGSWQKSKQPIPEVVYKILSGLSSLTNSSMFSRVIRF